MTAAESLAALLHSRPATLGDARLLCIDGPAGSGKTTLAAQVTSLVGDAAVVHTDDLLEGWRGLDTLDAQLATVLLPLAAGSSGSYRRWDWLSGSWAETVVVPPTPLLVLEGVGSGARAFAALATVLAWVEAPFGLRMRRWRERDGDDAVRHQARWTRDERALFARERTRDRADVVLDGQRLASPPS